MEPEHRLPVDLSPATAIPPDNFADVLKQQKRVLVILTPERFVP